MIVNLHVRLDLAEVPGEGATFVWWADSPEVPGFTVAADTMSELRALATEGLDFVGVDVDRLVEHLVVEPQP